MTRAVATGTVEPDRAEALFEPRVGVVLEREVGRGAFVAEEGPVERYRRTVVAEPVSGGVRVRQEVVLDPAVPWVPWLFRAPLRRRLCRLRPAERSPWWLPPTRIDARAARALTALAALALLNGYLGTVLTQTVTFAGREFGAGNRAQGLALAIARADVLISLVIVVLADRRGRRMALLVSTALGAALTAAGALAPSLPWLAGSQVAARGFVTAADILIFVVAAEEVSAGARAYAISVLVVTAALGAGLCVVFLNVAGLAPGAWRALYVFALAALALVPLVGRELPESRRYLVARRPTRKRRGPDASEAPRDGARGASRPRRAWRARCRTSRRGPRFSLWSHRKRFALLATSIFSLYAFLVPATQYLNQYLRTERGFSASRISIFILVTSTPAGIGLVAGGRLADIRGRRVVGAVALLGGAAGTVLTFLTNGWPMWVWSLAGSVVGAGIVPSLGVYGPELFPTASRGSANGGLFVTNRLGSAAGLLVIGLLAGPLGAIGPAMALLAIGPLVVAVLLVLAFPETAGAELESLNPEDDPSAGGFYTATPSER